VGEFEVATRAPGSSPDLPARVERVGRLGRYALLEVAGRGALGVVYRAVDLELNRQVAIKIPRQGCLASAEEVRRFLREARSIARLHHSGIVAVHDAGQTDGLCYLVSDFLEGQNLAKRMATQPVSPVQAADWISEVARALDYAHARGIVHRDVKPANILLNGDGRPVLTDFGLAKMALESESLTEDGQILGTPAYMSPEQARGESAHVDGRCDTYSLGVVLYELLAGTPPFRGSARAVLRQVLEVEPQSPRRLQDAVPLSLARISLKAMSKDPRDRYSSAGSLADDLDRFLAGRPVHARPVCVPMRLWLWCRRRPLAAGLSVALCLVGLAGVLGVLVQWREAERQRVLLKKNFHQAHSAFSRILNKSLDRNLLSQFNPVEVDLLADGLQYYEGFVSACGREDGLGDEIALAYYGLADLNTRLGRNEEALASSRQGLLLRQQLVRAEPKSSLQVSLLGGSLIQQAFLEEKTGRAGEARRDYELARTTFNSLAGVPADAALHAQGLVASLRNLARLHRDQGNSEQAILVYKQTLLEIERHLSCYPGTTVSFKSDQAESLYYLADLYFVGGRPREAWQQCVQAQLVLEDLIRERPVAPDPCVMLGSTCYLRGKIENQLNGPANALPHYLEAARRFEKLHVYHPTATNYLRNLAAAHHNVGNMLIALGRPVEAIDAYRKAIDGRQTLVRQLPDSPGELSDLSGSWYRLGLAWQMSNRHWLSSGALALAAWQQQRVVAADPTSKRQQQYLMQRARAFAEMLRRIGSTSRQQSKMNFSASAASVP
jgi:tetratricopeptide (TPR) repeat protein/tRNA A-37 threonylcarbamoyl transferase component Bud32